MERALEEEIKRAKLLRFKEILNEALEAMDISVEEWVQAVKEARVKR